MILGNTIVNPAQVVHAERADETLWITVTAIRTSTWAGGDRESLESVVLEYADPDGDVFEALAQEIERLSPPRPI